MALSHLIRSIFMSVWVWVFELGPHLYWSVISMSVWVFGTAPILIDHLLVSLSLSFRVGTATISISHLSCQFSLSFWGCTYIDQPSSCQFEFKFLSSDRTYIDGSSSYQLEFGAAPISIDHLIVTSIKLSGLHQYQSVIFLSICVQFELRPHLYWSVIHCHVSSVWVS